MVKTFTFAVAVTALILAMAITTSGAYQETLKDIPELVKAIFAAIVYVGIWTGMIWWIEVLGKTLKGKEFTDHTGKFLLELASSKGPASFHIGMLTRLIIGQNLYSAIFLQEFDFYWQVVLIGCLILTLLLALRDPNSSISAWAEHTQFIWLAFCYQVGVVLVFGAILRQDTLDLILFGYKNFVEIYETLCVLVQVISYAAVVTTFAVLMLQVLKGWKKAKS